MDFTQIERKKLNLPDEELLKYILDLEVDVNLILIEDKPLIFHLINRERYNLIDRLKGINFNIKKSNGKSPLHTSCFELDIEGVKFLLERGADPNTKDSSGDTPLHSCFTNLDLKIASLLIEKGSEINVQNKMGITPLHNACKFGSLNMVEFYLERGAEIEYENGKIKCLEGKEDKSIEELFLKHQMRKKKGIPRKE